MLPLKAGSSASVSRSVPGVSALIGHYRRIGFRPLKPDDVSMAKRIFVQCQVSSETKSRIRAFAAEQHLSESAILKRMLERGFFSPEERVAESIQRPIERRSHRLYIRLSKPDRDLLQARAEARAMPEATYASLLLHSNLQSQVPLPKAELAALHASIAELSSVGRNLWQLIRLAQASSQPPAYTADNAVQMLQVCKALRDHTKALIKANAASWGQGQGASHV